MDFKLSVLLFASFITVLNGIPNKSEDDESWDDDMILDECQLRAFEDPNCRNGRWEEKYRWPNGIVYYKIASTFEKDYVDQIKLALRQIENVTCIRFKPKTKVNRDYVYVNHNEKGCKSHVGRKGGIQSLNLEIYPLGEKCFKVGVIMHEFLHALGFYHQHSAYDRDSYVTIFEENIEANKTNNFIRINTIDFGVPYDYGSIMHYDRKHHSKNGLDTIVPCDNNATIGQTEKLSDGDIKKIKLMYNCDSKKIKPY